MSEAEDSENSIIIDCGSGITKAGFSGDAMPSVIIQSIIGRPKHRGIMMNNTDKEYYLGDDINKNRGILKLSYPIEHGIVNNWDDIEKIWSCAIEKLGLSPENKSVLLTEAPLNPNENRIKMAEIMFEKMNVGNLHVSIQAVLALYASGRTSGLMLDSGDGVTHTVPIFEGFCAPGGILRFDLAGRDLTNYLKILLKERGYSFTTSAELEIVRDIKEKNCYVCADVEAEMSKYEKTDKNVKEYELPDGEMIKIGNERFRVGECLFDSSLVDLEIGGMHDFIYKSIKKCDIDMRRTLFKNIVLSGGTTMLPGLDSRIKKELSNILPQSVSILVNSPADRKYSVWIGGSILTSLPSFKNMWISKEEYSEYGFNIIKKKCF